SRRRHTRFSRDWSSDVCSSDLLHRTHTPYYYGGISPSFTKNPKFGNVRAFLGTTRHQPRPPTARTEMTARHRTFYRWKSARKVGRSRGSHLSCKTSAAPRCLGCRERVTHEDRRRA